jgi:hypothetical protein
VQEEHVRDKNEDADWTGEWMRRCEADELR